MYQKSNIKNSQYIAIAALFVALLLGLNLPCSLSAQTLDSALDESASALLLKADTILTLIKSEDFALLSKHVHPVRGLGFSPYSRNLSKLFIAKFQKAQIANFGSDETCYLWGYYDGIGSPIRLTPKDYIREFVYDIAYEIKAEKFYLNSATLQKNINFRAIYDAYPDSSIIHYYFKGTEEAAFKDFRDLFLVFSKLDGIWYLIGFAHGESTV